MISFCFSLSDFFFFATFCIHPLYSKESRILFPLSGFFRFTPRHVILYILQHEQFYYTDLYRRKRVCGGKCSICASRT